MIQTQVGCHPPNPRAEPALDVKSVDAVAGADENFLREVFRFSALVQNAVTDVEYARLVARDKFAKSLSRFAAATAGL
jgi:hypothetical protein